jgi:hypothetical protein
VLARTANDDLVARGHGTYDTWANRCSCRQRLNTRGAGR